MSSGPEFASTGPGPGFQQGAQSQLFTDLNIAAQLVADASAAPVDTPTTDTMRIRIDATPRLFFWTYDTNAAAWFGVEATQ